MGFYDVLINISLLTTFLTCSCVMSAGIDSSREVSMQHNPGCDIPLCNATLNTSVHLFYAEAKGGNDSLHYIVSTIGPSPPTILLLRTLDVSSVLKINWTRLLMSPDEHATGAIKLVSKEGKPDLKVKVENVLIFDKVLEYNDTKDSLNMNDSLVFSPIHLDELLWNGSCLNSSNALLMGSSVKYNATFSNRSSISFNFTIFSNKGQTTELPALPHTENSTDWKFALDHLLSRGTGSRFSLELLMLGKNSTVSRTTSKSIDDEYCPSVFSTEKLEWGSEGVPSPLTFHQWRAVSYTTNASQRKYSTEVKTSDVRSVNETSSEYKNDVLRNRILLAYFGVSKLKDMFVTSTTVSFGEPEDGFYAASNYMSWTSSIGFGSPPDDSYSILIICMLFAGVGCPLLVIVFGGIYMTYKRCSRRRSSLQYKVITNYDYQPIQ